MQKKYAILITALLMAISLLNTPLAAQEKIFGAKVLSSKGSFTFTVIEKPNNCWCQFINWLIEWLKNNFRGSCSNIRLPIMTEYDADCALEKIGFTKYQISSVKKMDESSQLKFLINETMLKNIFRFGFPSNLSGFKTGTSIVINLSNF